MPWWFFFFFFLTKWYVLNLLSLSLSNLHLPVYPVDSSFVFLCCINSTAIFFLYNVQGMWHLSPVVKPLALRIVELRWSKCQKNQVWDWCLQCLYLNRCRRWWRWGRTRCVWIPGIYFYPSSFPSQYKPYNLLKSLFIRLMIWAKLLEHKG